MRGANFNVANEAALATAIGNAADGDTITFTGDIHLTAPLPVITEDLSLLGGAYLSGGTGANAVRISGATVTLGIDASANDLSLESGASVSSPGAFYNGASVAAGLNISGGAELVTDGQAHFGTDTGGLSNATITGTGSRFSGGFVSIGSYGGTGNLQLWNGGRLDAVKTFVGAVGGTGNVTVSGAGSVLNAGASMVLGFNAGGDGTLTIENEAVVTAAIFEMGTGGTQATLSIDNGGVAETGGLFKAADAISATVDFDGGILRARGNSGDFLSGFSAGDVTIGAGGAFLDTNGFNVTVAAVIDGGGALTKRGAGTLELTGANTFNGLTISGGTVKVTSDANLGLANAAISLDGGTLRTSAALALSRAMTLTANDGTFHVESGTLTYSGVVGGAGALTKTGAGTLALTAANTYAGGTEVGGGLVAITAANNLGAAGTTVTLDGGGLQTTGTFSMGRPITVNAGGGTIEVAAGTFTQSGVISGIGGLRKDGVGTLVLTGANTFTSPANIVAGTLQIGAGTTGSLTGNIANAGALVFNRSNTLTYAGDILGVGTLTKNGSGTVSLTGTPGYTGATTVNAGVLEFAGDGAVATSSITVNGGQVRFDGEASAGATSITTNTLGFAYFRGDSSAGSATITNNGVSFTSFEDNATADGATINVGGDAFLDITGLTSTGITIGAVDGAGNVHLGAKELITGGTNASTTISGVIDGTDGSLTKTGTGTLTLSGANTYTGATTVNAGTLAIANDGVTTFGSLGTGAVTINGAAAGGDPVGTLQFGGISSAANLNVTVNGGTGGGAGGLLRFVGNSTGAGAVSVEGNASLDVSGHSSGTSIGSLAGSGNVLLGATTLTVGSNNNSTTFSGVIQNTGRLTKIGTGTLTLTGANTYTGRTTIKGGTLAVAAGSIAAPENVIVGEANGDSAALVASAGASISGVQMYVGFNAGSQGTATLSGAGSQVSLSSNALIGSRGTGTLAISDGATLTSMFSSMIGNDATSSGSVTVSGVGSSWTNTGILFVGYSGTGGLTIQEGGVVTLNSLELGTFAGSSGTLDLGTGGAIGTIVAPTINGGSGTALVNINHNGTVTLASNFTGTIQLNHNGGSTTLTGANTYTGATSVNAGRLNVTGSLGNTAVTVTGTATLGGTGTIAGAVSIQSGGTIAPGNSPGTLTVGSLSLVPTSLLDYELGNPGGVAGTDSDLIVSTGDLTLAGRLAITDVGGFGVGTYRLINYGGALTNSGLIVSSIPAGFNPGALNLDVDTAGQVNLVVGNGTAQYWDGGHAAPGFAAGGRGGVGTWNALTTNWTNAGGNLNAAWSAGTAIFGGTAGTVTLAADHTADALQFETSGYTVGVNPRFTLTIDGSGITGAESASATLTTTGGTGNFVPSTDHAVIHFASAGTGSATITTTGGMGVNTGGIGGDAIVNLTGAATASNSTINNHGGTAIVSGIGGRGILTFSDTATAGSATITNAGGTSVGATGGGVLLSFSGNATAGTASISNVGADLQATGAATIEFSDSSTAGNATISNTGAGAADAIAARTLFDDSSSAGGATFTASGGVAVSAPGASIEFNDNATAANATFTLSGGTAVAAGGARLVFDDTASAGNATITIDGGTNGGNGGVLSFRGDSVGGTASLTINGNATLDIASHGAAGLSLGSLAGNGTVNLGAKVLTVGGNDSSTTFAGEIAASAAGLVKTGTGTFILSGDALHSGGTTISAGVLQIGAGGTTGTLNGNIVNNAALAFSRSDALTFGGDISGTGTLTKLGSGTLTLVGANDATGGTTISAGTLQIGDGGTTGSLAGNITNHAALVFERSDAVTHAGAIAGTGTLTKAGAGTLTLSGASTYTGATTISAGWLNVNGSLGATALTVGNGATLGGTGTLGGAVTVQNGGHLAPGASPGTLTINSDLVLNSGSILDFELDTPNVVGGGVNDLVVVNGNLTLDGTLNVTAGGGYGAGVYRLFNFSGTLTNNGLALGTFPAGFSYGVQTSVANQINLLVDPGALQFWDGASSTANGAVNGGDGVWDGSATNWTDADGAVAGAWAGQVGVFGGNAGTVALDAPLSFEGLQFTVAGYEIAASGANSLTPTGTAALTTDAGVTATISAALEGAGAVNKLGAGTLILSGDNTHAGGTTIGAGTLQVGAGGTSGAIVGDVMNNASLVFNRSDDVTFGGSITGTGSLTKNGAGVLALTGDVTSTGGTTISAGTLQIGAGGTAGSLTGNIANNGTLSFNRSDDVTFAADVTGTGALSKQGAGTLTLAGDYTATGGTTITAGTLQIGNGGTAGALAGNVTNAGALVFNRSDAMTFAGNIAGAGAVTKIGANTLTLNGASSYTGATNVSAGRLDVMGSLGGTAVTVANGATLGGTGTIAGSVNVQAGGHLAPGTSPGTLTVGSLGLVAGSLLDFELGTPNAIGGATNDLLVVTGNLILDGTLNVTASGGFDAGVYRLINYGGALTDNELAWGTLPGGFFYGIQTSVAGQINLLVDPGAIQFWDGANAPGDGVIGGGSGTWNAAGTNWTDADGVLASTWQGQTAVFSGTGGTVTLGSPIAFEGLQFTTTGYTLAGPGANVLSPTGSATIRTDAGVSATIDAAIAGTGGITKTGAGTLTLSGINTYTGATAINAGRVDVTGSLGATSVVVADGATLGGTGSLAGAVAVQSGGHLAPGLSAGTLTVGSLSLAGGSILDFELGTPNVVGGATNDLLVITGDLTLDGTLNVTADAGFGTGVYRLINYGGTLTDNGLELGAMPGAFSLGVQTSVANQVNLLVNATAIQFWDGANTAANGTIDGGTGTWNAAAANWTSENGNANSAWGGRTAVFGGTTGTVTLGSPVSFDGLQFTVDGYSIEGSGANVLRPTSGATVRTDAAVTASIGAVLTGAGGIIKEGAGTLVLTGENDYAGGTTIAGGTLQIGDGATTGSIVGNVTNNATLVFEIAQADAVDFDGAISGSGSVAKHGAGTLTLTGANSYAGGTTIAAGTLRVGDGGGSGWIRGDVSNHGVIAFERSDAVTFDGKITGSGALVQMGGGRLTLTGDHSYSGGTTVAAGTLQIGNGGASGSIQGNVATNGVLAFRRSDDVEFGGIVSGGGALHQLGSGTLTLIAANTYTGGTRIDAGTLQVGNGGVAGSVFGPIVNSGALVFNRGDAIAYDGVISGTGTLTKRGAGVLTLSGANTFTGSTLVEAGTLVLASGSSVASGEISAGAALAGAGTIRGNLMNRGTVSPGFSPGTLVVSGDYAQTSSGRLVVELASGTSFDRLTVGGSATLDGTLEVAASPGFEFAAGQSFEVISAASVSDRFGTVLSPFAQLPLAIKFDTIYGANSVKLAFVQVPYASFVATPNQAAVATALDTAVAGGAAEALQSQFNGYTEVTDIRAGLSQLSPQRFERWFEAALFNTGALVRTVEDQLARAAEGRRAWAEVVRREADWAGDADIDAAELETTGIVAGVDHTNDEGITLGGLLAYGASRIDVAAGGGRTRAESFEPAVYARYVAGAWKTEAAAGYAWHDYEAVRTIALPGQPLAVRGEADGSHRFASVRTSYAFEAGEWVLTPFAGLQHLRWDADAFQEVGAGDASLRIASQRGESLASRAGLRLALPFRAGSVLITPQVEGSWRHEFQQSRRSLSASMGGASFAVRTGAPAADGWVASFGFDVQLRDELSVYARVTREGDGAVDRSTDLRAGASYRF